MKLGTTVFAAALASALFAGGAQAQDTIKIGWAIAKSGPMGAGAAIRPLLSTITAAALSRWPGLMLDKSAYRVQRALRSTQS